MKKLFKILAAAASFCMMAQYGCVMAEDYSDNTGTIKLDSMTVSGEGISVEDNIVTVTAGGDFTVTGSAEDAMIYVNTDAKVKLRLSGMSLKNSNGPAIFFENSEKGFITVTEGTENYISDGAEYSYDAKAALFSNDDLEIKGNGVLTVTGNYKHAIAGDDDIKIENSILNLTAAVDGIHVNNTFEMTGGTVNINAESDGIQAEEDVIVDGGVINVLQSEEGIESGTSLTVNGGEINIVSSDDGLNSGGGNGEESGFANGGFRGEMNGGNFDGRGMGAPGRDFGAGTEADENMQPPEFEGTERKNMQPPEGMGPDDRMQPQQPPADAEGVSADEKNAEENQTADKNIYINGGIVRINAEGDGADSNADIIMTGGELYINGPVGNGDGAIDCSKFTVSGGTVIAAGSSGMAMGLSSDSEQCGIKINLENEVEEGTVITLKDSDGNEIFSFTPEKRISSIIYTSDKLTQGETYTLFAGDEQLQEVELSEKQISVGNGGFGREKGERFDKRFPGENKNSENDRIRVYFKGEEVRFDTAPVISEDTALVPLRSIFETLGMEVKWDEENSQITASKDGVEIVLQIGSRTAKKNSENIELTSAPVIKNSRTLVPVRFIAESLNLNVSWDDSTKSVTID